MKLPLLTALLLFTVLLHAQDTTKVAQDTLENKKSAQRHFKKDITERQKRFDIGAGVQVNSFGYMGTSAGPMVTVRANSKYGRIAGVFTTSFNINNNYDYYHPDYGLYTYSTNKYFISNIRYNFLKMSIGMQVPLFNRTNKNGFSISWLFGITYCNGLGSGEYKVGLDKPEAPDSLKNYYNYIPNQSQKFSINNHNMQFLNVDLGLSLSYTFKRYQVFANFNYLYIGDLSNGGIFGDTFDKNYDNGAHAPNISYYRNFCINFGMRYCFYQPWQTKPPKRKFVEG